MNQGRTCIRVLFPGNLDNAIFIQPNRKVFKVKTKGKVKLKDVNDPKQKAIAAALAAAEETKAMQSAPEHLRAVAKFGPVFDKLAQRSASLMFDVKTACEDVIRFLKIAPTKEGHKKAMLVVKGCTDDSSVMQYSRQWLAVILAEKKSASLGVLQRETEPNIWAEIPASVKGIESRAELLGCSTKAGEALGFKKRGKSATTTTARRVSTENVFDYLPAIFKSQAGIAQLRKICNDNGYELTVRMVADGNLAASGAMKKVA